MPHNRSFPHARAADTRALVYNFYSELKRGASVRETAVWAVVLMGMAAFGATKPSVFEEPSKITTVALPPHPYNPTFRHARNCYYYPGIMVKEVNFEDEKGAHRLSLVPAPINEKPPACKADNVREVIIPCQKWSGYYRGKRGAAFFFDAADGLNGMPFAVYSAFGNEMLKDGFELDEREPFRFVRMDRTALVVRYRRAWLAPCSMYADPAGCWKTIAAQIGFPKSAQPDCRNAYNVEMKRVAGSKYNSQIADARSVIGYEVEARATPERTTFTALPGRVTCWMEE